MGAGMGSGVESPALSCANKLPLDLFHADAAVGHHHKLAIFLCYLRCRARVSGLDRFRWIQRSFDFILQHRGVSRRTSGGDWGGKGGGGTQFVHGRSRLTIDSRIPTVPGPSTSSFHQPGRHCSHQARGAMRCSASRTKSGGVQQWSRYVACTLEEFFPRRYAVQGLCHLRLTACGFRLEPVEWL